MFELEMQDWLAYLLSIGVICSIAYAYAAYWQTGVPSYWEASASADVHIVLMPHLALSRLPIQRWLVRRVKRKEAPDDDDSPCGASFVTIKTNKRGGLICPIDCPNSYSHPFHLCACQ